MILYEFVYNSMESNLGVEALKGLHKHLIEEAELQGWQPGWILTVQDSIGRAKGDAWEYYCVVEGDYRSGAV